MPKDNFTLFFNLYRNTNSVKPVMQNHESHKEPDKSVLFAAGECLEPTNLWQKCAFEPKELFNTIPEKVRKQLFDAIISPTTDVGEELKKLLIPCVKEYLSELYDVETADRLIDVTVSYMIGELKNAFIHSKQYVRDVKGRGVNNWTYNPASKLHYQFGKNGYHKGAIKIKELPEIGFLQFKSKDSLKDVELELRLIKYVAASEHEEFKKRISFQYDISELVNDTVFTLDAGLVARVKLLIEDIVPGYKICYYHQKNNLGVDYVELIDFVKKRTEELAGNKDQRIKLAHILADQLIDLLQVLDGGKYANEDPHSGNMKLYFGRDENIVRLEIFDHGKSYFGDDYNISTKQYVFHEGRSYKIIQQGMSSPEVRCRRMVIALIFYLVLGDYSAAYDYFKHGEFRDKLNALIPPSATTTLINKVMGYNNGSLHSTAVVGGTTELTQPNAVASGAATVPYEKIRTLLNSAIERLAKSDK